ncbi:hypothetical protein [Porphyromonas pogonae]|nr:hypothetical protein [Porphyromonas pogonae]
MTKRESRKQRSNLSAMQRSLIDGRIGVMFYLITCGRFFFGLIGTL